MVNLTVKGTYENKEAYSFNYNNKNLRDLHVFIERNASENEIIDISGCTNLEYLEIQGVSTVDISKNLYLKTLSIWGNVDIDFENNAPLLTDFWMYDCDVYETISLGDKPYLDEVRIYDSSFETLDISNCPNVAMFTLRTSGVKNLKFAKETHFSTIVEWRNDYNLIQTTAYVHKGSFMDLWINLANPIYNLSTKYYDTNETHYKVNFVLQDGMEKTIEFPANSVMPNVFGEIFQNVDGQFEGWYTDSKFEQAYQLSEPITQDMTLYGKWSHISLEEEIEVNETNFPDEHFREFITYLFGESISQDEIKATTVLTNSDEYSAGHGIGTDTKDLKGIEYFTELQEFSYHAENLSAVDFSNNKKLSKIHLWGSNTDYTDIVLGDLPALKDMTITLYKNDRFPSTPNKMKTIDLSGAPNLLRFECWSANLESIDLSNNKELRYLILAETKLNNLDLSNNTELIELQLNDESLRSVDLSNNVKLKKLTVSDTSFEKLNISNLSELEILSLSNCSISQLDLSKNEKLTYLSIYRTPLLKLNVSKNTRLETLQFSLANNAFNLDLSNNPLITRLNMYLHPDSLVRVIKGSYAENYCIANKIPYTLEELPTPGVYTVKFDTKGGMPEIPAQKVEKDNYALEPEIVPEKENHTFTGWYKDAAATQKWNFDRDKIVKDITLYAGYQRITGEVIRITDVGTVSYNGGSVKPPVTVMCGEKVLVSGKDYTVTYKNNKNVCTDVNEEFDSKKPYVIVTGKGNYSGSIKQNFTINPQEIHAAKISYSDYVIAKTKDAEQSNKIKLTYKSKTLKETTDYILKTAYSQSATGEFVEINTNKLSKPGYYNFTISGKGNYAGEQSISIRVIPKGVVNLSSAKVSLASSVKYNVSEDNINGYDGEYNIDSSEEDKQLITSIVKRVKAGGKKLTFGKDYTVSISDSNVIGKAKVTISALEESEIYVGSKTVTLNVKGTKLSSSAFNVTGIREKTFAGTEQSVMQDTVVVTKKGSDVPLTLGKDYLIEHKNNNKAGKAKVIIKGIGAYSGSITKTYNIKAVDISKNSDISYDQNVVLPQDKKGVTPNLNWTFGEYSLKNKVDYTVKYSNNTVVSGDKKAIATIIGKGYFKGKLNCAFTIMPKELSCEDITYSVEPIAYSTKTKIYKPKITVYDNGVKMRENKDYAIVYDTSEEAAVTEIPTDELIRTFKIVTLKNGKPLNGCYVGEREGEFKVSARLLKNMKASVTSKITYTGQPIELAKSEIRVSYKENGKTVILSPGDFEIVKYSKNNKVGTASVTIEGNGKYGGQKTISFKIGVKRIW